MIAVLPTLYQMINTLYQNKLLKVVKNPRTNCPVSEQIVKSHPVSNDKNPISDDKHPVSNDKHPGSNYKHPVSEQIVKIHPVSVPVLTKVKRC